jgi:hypothetical protein
MPKVFITKEQREYDRFSDFVRRQLRLQKKKKIDLAAELNLPVCCVTQRINGNTRWTLGEVIATLYFLDCEYTLGEK